ncbi:hypothetical protein FO519_006065 [Halicephalobus sp. NKZ332]|nr:hypothetical protein FO519_006065 [Halicephalobus sp. NKZ332]
MSSLREVSLVQHSSEVNDSRVWSIDWHHSGKNLVSCGADKTAKVWRLEGSKLEKIQTISGDQSRSVRFGKFSFCGNFLATASFDASVIIYEFTEGNFEERHRLEGHENEVKCVQFSPSGRYIATCSRDKTVFVWEAEDDEMEFRLQTVIQKHTADVKFLVWHPDHELLVSGGYDDAIGLYYFDGEDWVTGQFIESAHDSTVWSASWDPSGRFLATVGDDHFLKIWELVDPVPNSGAKLMKIASFEVENSRWPLFSVDWNKKTGLLAIAGADMRVRILEFNQDSQTVVLLSEKAVESEVNAVSWNPVQQEVLGVACDDGTVRLLNFN